MSLAVAGSDEEVIAAAMAAERTEQIQGRSGERQIDGTTIGLPRNGGGNIATGAAAMGVTILKG